MNYRDWTWVLVGLELLAVEAIAGVRGDPLLTDSMRAGADRWMLWPAIFGTLNGHFFGSRVVQWSGAPLVLLALGLAILYRDLFVRDVVPASTHLAIAIVFVGLGSALWGTR